MPVVVPTLKIILKGNFGLVCYENAHEFLKDKIIITNKAIVMLLFHENSLGTLIA